MPAFPGSMKTLENIAENTKQIFKINVDGVFNTIHPALNLMESRGNGQIAVVSSLAGYRGLPGSASYSASKVAVKGYGEALRGVYHDRGVEISVICPGFIRSRITDQNDFPMPFFMEAGKAAKIIRRGLEKNKGLIAFPWQMRFAFGAMVRFLPEFLLERVLRQLPEK